MTTPTTTPDEACSVDGNAESEDLSTFSSAMFALFFGAAGQIRRIRAGTPVSSGKSRASTKNRQQMATQYVFRAVPDDVFEQILALHTQDGKETTAAAVYDFCVRYLVRVLLETQNFEDLATLLQQICAPHFTQATLFNAATIALLAYQEQPITLRGLFYRAVSAGIYSDTADQHYRQCGRLLVELRRKGIVDYRCIVDSTRRRLKSSSWSGLADFADTVADAYRKDLWAQQPHYIEIFVEKDGMAAVLQPVTEEFDIHLNIIRGGCSETFAWTIAQEWNAIGKRGKPIYAYYLGDHDPSGLTIENDLKKRLAEMTDTTFQWKRLAIDRIDFGRQDLLGFPIKGDRNKKAWQTKHAEYLRHHSDRCVEVDAIPAKEIRERLRAVILSHIDAQQWEALQATERVERETVKRFALAQKELQAS